MNRNIPEPTAEMAHGLRVFAIDPEKLAYVRLETLRFQQPCFLDSLAARSDQ